MTKQRQTTFACSMEAALSIISGKWKLTILNRLLNGPMRYSEIQHLITGITEKMLSQQLRELEEDGIISRKVYPEVPPRVEYAFTDLGKQMAGIFQSLEEWGSQYIGRSSGSVKPADTSCYMANAVSAQEMV